MATKPKAETKKTNTRARKRPANETPLAGDAINTTSASNLTDAQTQPAAEVSQQRLRATDAPVVAPESDALSIALPPEEAPAVQDYRSRCGGALRAQREKNGLSMQEVASRLRLSVKQIEALESDHFHALPKGTIVRGFIRNYAKLLKMSAEPLLDAYNVLVPNESPQSFTLKPSVDTPVTQAFDFSIKKLLLPLLALLLAILVWWFYQAFVQSPSPTAPAVTGIPNAESASAETLPEIALPAAERESLQITNNLPAPAAATMEATPQLAEPSATAPAPATPATAAPAEVVATAVPSAAVAPAAPANVAVAPVKLEVEVPLEPGKSKLEFSASQETWVSVSSLSGKEIFSRTLFGGNRESVVVKPPVNITVGNARATLLSVNGKAMDLAPYTRINVAHIKVD